jgi:hypothetical protein
VEYEYTQSLSQYAKPQDINQGFDFFYAPADVAAPHPDLFEKELDSSLAFAPELQLQMLNVDLRNFDYSFLRTEMGHRGAAGPPSSITSGDSASGYRDDESAYSYSQSGYSYHPSMDLLEMDMHSIQIEKARSDYLSQMAAGTVDPQSFATLPISPVQAFSDYTPSVSSKHSSGGNSPEYYPALEYKGPTAPPAAHSHKSTAEVTESHDPRRRFKCSYCPRSFARAYNLKTHLATHDPNRAKPHVCSHTGCGRSFSRKHDLGRHLFSIHREGQGTSVGVESGARSWCDSCGRGHVGGKSDCSCGGGD